MNRVATANALGRRIPLTMSPARIGDVVLATFWTFMAAASFGNTIRLISDDASWLTTAHRAVSATILAVCAVLFIIRRPASSGNTSWLSRIVAIAGTWFMPTLILLPLQWDPGWLMSITTAGLVLGHLCIFWALITLRRSFSIFPEARALIRSGPYGRVRHPLYATYLAIYPMFLLPRLSVLAVVVTVLGVSCEIWRARDEERVLSAAFPDYEAYATEVPRFVPRLLSR
jgi:protein-S-isoprenylcysteine O-methyltransferase Ste14